MKGQTIINKNTYGSVQKSSDIHTFIIFSYGKMVQRFIEAC